MQKNRTCASIHGQRLLAAPIAALLSLIFTSIAVGQVDNFDSGINLNWTPYAPLDRYGTITRFTNPFGTYQITTTGSPDPQTLGPARAASLRLDKMYSDFAVEVDLIGWDTSHSQPLGILSRITNPGLGSTNGYALTYDTTAHSLDLTLITGEQTSSLGSAPVSTNAGVLHLLFTGVGQTLTGEIFDGSNLATPLASVTKTDGTYGAGINGLVIYDNSDGTQGATGTFDNYAAAASVDALVPEPGTLVLLAFAGIVVLKRGR